MQKNLNEAIDNGRISFSRATGWSTCMVANLNLKAPKIIPKKVV